MIGSGVLVDQTFTKTQICIDITWRPTLWSIGTVLLKFQKAKSFYKWQLPQGKLFRMVKRISLCEHNTILSVQWTLSAEDESEKNPMFAVGSSSSPHGYLWESRQSWRFGEIPKTLGNVFHKSALQFFIWELWPPSCKNSVQNRA